MKKCAIKLTEASKRLISILEIDDVKTMINNLRVEGLETTIFDYLDIAMSCVKHSNWTFYDVNMSICKNCRIYNYYTDNSAYYDIWVEFKAFNDYEGFYVVGINLSDLYSIGEDNKQDIRQHMFVIEYTRKS